MALRFVRNIEGNPQLPIAERSEWSSRFVSCKKVNLALSYFTTFNLISMLNASFVCCALLWIVRIVCVTVAVLVTACVCVCLNWLCCVFIWSKKHTNKKWNSLCRWNRRYASPVDIFPLTVWLFGHYCWVWLVFFSLWIHFANVRVLDIFSSFIGIKVRSFRPFVFSAAVAVSVAGSTLALHSFVYHSPDERTGCMSLCVLCLFLFFVLSPFVTSFFAVFFCLARLDSIRFGSVYSLSVWQQTILFIVFAWKQRQLFQFCLLQIFITL